MKPRGDADRVAFLRQALKRAEDIAPGPRRAATIGAIRDSIVRIETSGTKGQPPRSTEGKS